jgi:hypothetical protein
MPTENEDQPSARRLRLRRTRTGTSFQGGGSSGSSRAESLRDGNYEEDEVDDAIDPERVSDHVMRRAARHTNPPADSAVARRNHEVQQSGNPAWAKEHRMLLLAKALSRGMGLDVLARQIGCSVSTLQKDRAELFKRQRELARGLDIDQMVGEQTMFYNDVAAMALRIASQEGGVDSTGRAIQANPLPMRLAAMRTALAAKADHNRFYNTAGVYDVQRFRRAEDGTGLSDIQLLMQQTAEMLEMAASSDDFNFNNAPDLNDDLDGPVIDL